MICNRSESSKCSLATFLQGQFIRRRGVKIGFMGEKHNRKQCAKKNKKIKNNNHTVFVNKHLDDPNQRDEESNMELSG